MASINDQVVALITAGQAVPQALAQALQVEQAANVAAYMPSGAGGFPTLEVGDNNITVVGVAQPSAQAQVALLPEIAGGLAAIIRWLLGSWGLKQILAALLGFVGVTVFKDVLSSLPGLAATVIPGVQPWLGEYPAGLGQIEGRIVRRWTAGGERVFFACFEQPTRSGSHLQYYVWSSKRQAWLPYAYRRNIVFGAKELDIAAALGGKKRIGKKRALRALAGRYGGTKSK